MAIQSNNSEEVVSTGGITLYTGVAPVSVVAVNPNLSELSELGINLKTEPEYKVTLNEEDYNKLVFWLKSDVPGLSFTTRFEILMQSKHRASKDGSKFMWANNIGQTTWSADVPAYDWWKNQDKTRKAYVGEDTLINFTKAWANVAAGGEISFDTIDAIAQGDVRELQEYVKVLSANKLRVLVGVKDGKYQAVYNRHFGRLKPMRDDMFIKALNEDYGSFNAEYNKDLKLQVYSPTMIVADPVTATVVDSADAWDV
jgi:hypothetical protein